MKNKKLKIFTIIAITLAISWGITTQRVDAAKTIVVPDQFATITQAIEQAGAGDTIQIKTGTYNENLNVNKPLTLQGEERQKTIIIGEGNLDRGAQPVIQIISNNVKITGFTIESQNYSTTNLYASGISVQGDHCTIINNIIKNTYIGIFCSIQSSTLIKDNLITDNLKDGMRFYGGSLNQIENNTITENTGSGIAMNGYQNTILNNNITKNLRAVGYGGSYSLIYGNNLSSNSESGLFLAGSNNIISGNKLSSNKFGVFVTSQLEAPHENTFYQNNFLSNTFNAFDNSSSFAEQWNNNNAQGNYWSDYKTKYPNASESIQPGIGNTAYVIAPNNTDDYPLLNPSEKANQNQPTLPKIPEAPPNSLVSWWPFETIESNGMTPDETGRNPVALGSETATESFVPQQVEGKVGKALSFNGAFYAFVPASKSLETPNEVTIEAWVNVQSLKENVAYNNIFVEVVRSSTALPTRTLGVAINGETPENSSSPVLGAVRAYVLTSTGFNEIATINPIAQNTWVHIVFTRSLVDGMHISIDGKEQAVQIVSGIQNPKGAILRENEIYIGHDSITEIDELKISNYVQEASPLWMQWWVWAIAAIIAATALLTLYRLKK
jgi:nitrous oxidase accessory protein